MIDTNSVGSRSQLLRREEISALKYIYTPQDSFIFCKSYRNPFRVDAEDSSQRKVSDEDLCDHENVLYYLSVPWEYRFDYSKYIPHAPFFDKSSSRYSLDEKHGAEMASKVIPAVELFCEEEKWEQGGYYHSKYTFQNLLHDCSDSATCSSVYLFPKLRKKTHCNEKFPYFIVQLILSKNYPVTMPVFSFINANNVTERELKLMGEKIEAQVVMQNIHNFDVFSVMQCIYDEYYILLDKGSNYCEYRKRIGGDQPEEHSAVQREIAAASFSDESFSESDSEEESDGDSDDSEYNSEYDSQSDSEYDSDSEYEAEDTEVHDKVECSADKRVTAKEIEAWSREYGERMVREGVWNVYVPYNYPPDSELKADMIKVHTREKMTGREIFENMEK